MTGDDLRAAAASATELLDGISDPQAAVPVFGTDVGGVVRHVAGCLVWYAHDLAAGPEESPGPQPHWPTEATLSDLVRETGVAAEVLARVVDGAAPDARGWHPWGSPDPAGFAAMGSAELLIHTGDVATPAGADWVPPPHLAAGLRDRLFPWAPRFADPWAAVLWATGRGELPGLDRVTSWRYHLPPLSEWDGTQLT